MTGSGPNGFMQRALELASRGWGRAHPNPMVGAVVVKDGSVIAEGWHEEYGGPHAEVTALERAGERARDADLYISLEPCTHHGRTPPCTDAILRSGVRRVYIATRDANPEAAGGVRLLASAGIDVHEGILADEARSLNAAFFHVHERKGPFVALKLALSLDGRIARAVGERTAISGAAALAETHRLRAGFDAILVGSGTAHIDDPLLTARGPVRPRVPPIRVVLDTEARLSPESRLARTTSEAPVLVYFSRCPDPGRLEALHGAGVRTRVAPADAAGVSIEAVLRHLWDQGVRTVLCEGGARLAGRLIAEDRVERVFLFHSPVFLGAAGVPAFAADAPAAADAWRLHEARALGNDALLVWDRVRRT